MARGIPNNKYRATPSESALNALESAAIAISRLYAAALGVPFVITPKRYLLMMGLSGCDSCQFHIVRAWRS